MIYVVCVLKMNKLSCVFCVIILLLYFCASVTNNKWREALCGLVVRPSGRPDVRCPSVH